MPTGGWGGDRPHHDHRGQQVFPRQIREHLARHGLPILNVDIANRVAYASSLLFSNSVMGETNGKARGGIIQLGQELIDLLDRKL